MLPETVTRAAAATSQQSRRAVELTACPTETLRCHQCRGVTIDVAAAAVSRFWACVVEAVAPATLSAHVEDDEEKISEQTWPRIDAVTETCATVDAAASRVPI